MASICIFGEKGDKGAAGPKVVRGVARSIDIS